MISTVKRIPVQKKCPVILVIAHGNIRVSWDARTLRELEFAHTDARTAIQQTTSATQVTSGEWPERFFQVTIDRINRHAAATLLNQDKVRTYLGEVSPVPFSPTFPLAQQIYEFLKQYTDYFIFDIRINDTPCQIERPFQAFIPITDDLSAPFKNLETHLIPRLDTDDPAAVSWLAHTPYAGSIPRRLGIRGLRARAGNIQIGSDRIFEHLFLEPRFNGWCIGEIHVLDTRIVPNGRRDYFEPSPHLHNLENHIGAIAQQISMRCRQASSQRNRFRNINTAVSRLQATCDLVRSGYLQSSDATAIIERERHRIPETRDTIERMQTSEIDSPLYTHIPSEDELQNLPVDNPRALDSLPPALRTAVQCTFGTIVHRLAPDIALDLIQAIFNDLPERLTANDASPENPNPHERSLNNQDGS